MLKASDAQGFVSKVLELATDKANESWHDLGAPALSALRQLPWDHQVSELAGGEAAALCQLLQSLLLQARPLLADLGHCICSSNSSLSSPAAEAATMSPRAAADPPSLVVQLLALGDKQQWDRESPACTDHAGLGPCS